MSTTQLFSGRVGDLSGNHLGGTVTVFDYEGVGYEGTLTYLSFDNTRHADETVAIAISVTGDPVDDLIFYFNSEHRVTVAVTND